MNIFQGKPLDYWNRKWNSLQKKNLSDYDLALSLLVEYSGGCKTPIGPGYWFYSIGRFFKGHWNTHHGKAVSDTINIHRTLASTLYSADVKPRNVQNLILDLNKNLGTSKLKENGDLFRILTVIGQRTGIWWNDPNTLKTNSPSPLKK